MNMAKRGASLALWLPLCVASVSCGCAIASIPDPNPLLSQSSPSSPARDEVLARIRENYVDPVAVSKLTQSDLYALVREVDPEGEYLDANAIQELRRVDPDIASLGLELVKVGTQLKVVELLDDSPSARAGLLSGDFIVRIDSEPVADLTLQEAVKRLRGKADSTVKLSVSREGKAPMDMILKREIVRLPNVTLHALEPGYVLIRVSRFTGETTHILANLLKARYAQEAVKGIVLDLRNNTGGILNGAVGVAAVFLPANSLVASLTGRHPDSNFDLYASPRFYTLHMGDSLKGLPTDIKNSPLVVLVNENTAAGAEIVAGAMQDYKRALLIGSPTFGRASIQTILPLSNGAALKLTTARWHTPLKRTVHRQGLSPDVPSKASVKRPGQKYPQQDAQVNVALSLLKKNEPKGD